MIRPLSLLISLIVTLGFTARGNDALHPISAALQEFVSTGDYSKASTALKGYSVAELAALPDSTLFDYYYLKGAVKRFNGDEAAVRKYLLTAKDLCEKSLGIHSPVYLEICWAIGNSYESTGDSLSAFEIFLPTLIESVGLYSLQDEDVREQYQEMERKVKEWYRNDALRKSMVQHRPHLSPRDASKDAVQYDMEFYTQFYKNKTTKELLLQASSLGWEESAKIYSNLSKRVSENPVAQATLQEMAASSYINLEDLQKAEELLLNNLTLLKDRKSTKAYRRTLSQLSNLYTSLHNYSKAKDYAQEAKYWYEETLDFSRGYIVCLHRCANLERGNQNYFLALLLEDVALQELYRNQTVGIISGDSASRADFLANCLSGAALHYNQVGFFQEAIDQIEKAIETAEAHGLDSSTYYGNLASICFGAKEYDKAVEISEIAYKNSDSGSNKIQLGVTLCLSQFYAGQSINSDVIRESCRHLNSLLAKTFSFTTTKERRNFWTYFEYYLPILNFFAHQTGDRELREQIYDNILLEKGLLLRTTNKLRDQILSNGSEQDIAMYERMLGLRNELLKTDNPEIIEAELERIDKVLTGKFSTYGDFLNGFAISWKDVQKSLQEGDLAIEFYNIPQVSRSADGNDWQGVPRYCAITIGKNYSEPHIIPLCLETDLRSISKNDLYSTLELYNHIWISLEDELKGVENIYFAADRDLHKIGIEYALLPDESRIGDHYRLYRLSSTRLLTEEKPKSRLENAVLYGGLEYDGKLKDLIAESRSWKQDSSTRPRASIGKDLRSGFSYLPATLKEVESISRNFQGNNRVFTGMKGTEESFKALDGSDGIDIIHLATHGFFWSDEAVRDVEGVSFLKYKDTAMQTKEDWALMRSGLIFSGANIGLKEGTLPDDMEDGVLTALELSTMNLGKVDLVVMSACESGLGETSGEGVFGMQRGFKLAGANSLLMTLWKVSDDATQKLMSNFYENYLQGMTKSESLAKAQQNLRETPGYADPYFWAGFILLDGIY